MGEKELQETIKIQGEKIKELTKKLENSSGDSDLLEKIKILEKRNVELAASVAASKPPAPRKERNLKYEPTYTEAQISFKKSQGEDVSKLKIEIPKITS